VNSVGVFDGHGLGDHSAQRDAHHMGPVQPERVEQAVVQSTVAV
jgi:hypothetical protein